MWSNTGLRQQLYSSAGQSTPRGALGPFMQMYVWMHPASLDCISTDGIHLHCCSPRLHTVLRFSVFIKMKSIFYKIRIDLSMLPVTLYRLAKFCGIISMKTDARSLLTQNRPEVYVCVGGYQCARKRGRSLAFLEPFSGWNLEFCKKQQQQESHIPNVRWLIKETLSPAQSKQWAEASHSLTSVTHSTGLSSSEYFHRMFMCVQEREKYLSSRFWVSLICV